MNQNRPQRSIPEDRTLKQALQHSSIHNYEGDYFDAKGYLKPSYVDEWADKLAKIFKEERLSKSQMRAFFGEAKRLQTRLAYSKNFDALRAKLLGMKAVAYARQKRGSLPSVFRDFIQMNINKAESNEKAFAAFVQHFEAVAAYCEGRLKEGAGR